MGRVHPPIGIAGSGACEFLEDSLVVTGHAPKSLAGALLRGFAGALAGGVGASMFLPHFEVSDMGEAPRTGAILGAAIGMGFLSVAKSGRASDKGRPIEFRFPYRTVKKWVTDPVNVREVQILIEGGTPAANLHFTPTDGTQALFAALEKWCRPQR